MVLITTLQRTDSPPPQQTTLIGLVPWEVIQMQTITEENAVWNEIKDKIPTAFQTQDQSPDRNRIMYDPSTTNHQTRQVADPEQLIVMELMQYRQRETYVDHTL